MDEVTDRPELGRFELVVDGHRAELVYRVEDDALLLIHTEVPAELGGRGIGGRLVRAALDRSVREGLTVVPWCPFARSWLRGHPEEIGQAIIDWERKYGT